MRVVKYPGPAFDRWKERLESDRRSDDRKVMRTVEKLLQEVRRGGDGAVAAHVAALDRVRIAPDELLAHPDAGEVGTGLRAAIETAIREVTAFHVRQAVSGYSIGGDGFELRHRVRPLRRVGIYVPGGRAVYLSSLIMAAVPARIAGVSELVVAAPPAAADRPELRFAATELGVKEIYRAGGASGIAALAYGTESLRRVEKIVGPGNSWVAAAKRMVAGEVGIDLIAGPTEVIVLADDGSDISFVAADLLAQAEHGEDSTPICVTTSRRFAGRLGDEVSRRLGKADDSSAAHSSMKKNALVIYARNAAEAAEVVNAIAPEHVSIQTGSSFDPDAIENCGAVFIGPYAPVALGDYVVGPNHVLPTAGSARFASPLGVYDFVKRSNVIRVSEPAFDRLAGAADTLARFEGLPLHAESIGARGAGQ